MKKLSKTSVKKKKCKNQLALENGKAQAGTTFSDSNGNNLHLIQWCYSDISFIFYTHLLNFDAESNELKKIKRLKLPTNMWKVKKKCG